MFTITSLTPLPAVKGAGTIIDGSTQTAFSGDTNKAGPEVVLQSSPGSRGRHGLYINAPNCVVKSLVINSTAGNAWRYGIHITGPGATGNRIVGCYIGTDPTGTQPMGNAFGVQMDSGASDNLIGGPTLEARNLIAGNGAQISLNNTGTSGNIVQGNYLGTSVDGEKVFPNANGILIDLGASGNLIGGGNAHTSGNLIGAGGEQSSGVRIAGRGSNGNIIQGNIIGANKDGTKTISSCGFGIMVLNNVENTQIGGTAPQVDNLITGCSVAGIQLSSNSNNTVQGNHIGLPGQATPGNVVGIIIYASSGNLIGGANTQAAGNVIMNSQKEGILILGEDEGAPASKNVVQGNFIGVSADGKTALPNGAAGIRIAGIAHNNIIGKAADGTGAANVIAFNKGLDIKIEGDDRNTPTGNVADGNTSHDNGK